MKMSDVFDLPLFAKNHDVGARCSIYEGRGVTVASSFYANQLKAYEAMCAAVNNHDRLTSENARLRVALKECINELKAFQSDHEDFGSEEFIAEQEDLLAELEKGYE